MLKTTTPNKFIRVQLHYCEGGMNYFSGEVNKRGYRLSVQAIEDKGDGCISFMMFHGVAHTAEETKRFNARRLEELAAQGDKLPMYNECIQKVLRDENLVLAPVESAQPVAA